MYDIILAGSMAGLVTDTVLHPLDTLKTRLQVKETRITIFRRLYGGFAAVALGSAPTNAVFFAVYEKTKECSSQPGIGSEIASACIAETISCLLRCPIENVKQNSQVNGQSSVKNMSHLFQNKTILKGYSALLAREIPFSVIQMPMWESLKSHGFSGALSGALSGVFAAVLTNPIDVIKTRIMTSEKSISCVVCELKQDGFAKCFAGVLPRTVWMGLGGFLWLGTYDFIRNFEF